jgi:tetratricopeptide (TPR) repeat protein
MTDVYPRCQAFACFSFPRTRSEGVSGKTYFEQGRYQEAIRALESAVRLNPASAAACYRLSQAYQKAGNPEKARAMSELFLQRQRQQQAQTETRRKEIVSFLYTLK